MVSDRGVNLVHAPQSSNFYPSNVGSSTSLRHLTRYGYSAPACVLRNTLADPTPDETEASTKGVRSSMVKITRHEKAGSHVGNLTSALLICSRFSLQRGKSAPRVETPNFGQTRAPVSLGANGWPFPKWTPVSLFTWLTQHRLLTVPTFLALL
jgi:hypothetical protein